MSEHAHPLRHVHAFPPAWSSSWLDDIIAMPRPKPKVRYAVAVLPAGALNASSLKSYNIFTTSVDNAAHRAGERIGTITRKTTVIVTNCDTGAQTVRYLVPREGFTVKVSA